MSANQRSGLRVGILLGVAVGLAAPAWAQVRGGGGRGPGGASGGSGRGDHSGDNRGANQGDANAKSDTGSGKGIISKYVTAKENQEEVIGELRFRPETGKLLKLEIRHKDNIKLSLNSKEIPVELYPRVLLKGLTANVAWGTARQGNKAVRYVTGAGITFEELEIEGKVVGVDEKNPDVVKLRCTPKNNQEWPIARKSAKATNKSAPPSRSNAKPKLVPAKTLRVRFIEDYSSLTDTTKQPLTLPDLQKDQQVSGRIVFGIPECLLVNAQVESEQAEGTDQAKADADSGKGSHGDR